MVGVADTPASVKAKAEEVLALVRETVGGAALAEVYNNVRAAKVRAKEGKMRHRKLEALLDPEAAAQRRIKKSGKNKVQKKRKAQKWFAHKAKGPRLAPP
eukprot:1015905-Prorocentrum_minimum.AAC.1